MDGCDGGRMTCGGWMHVMGIGRRVGSGCMDGGRTTCGGWMHVMGVERRVGGGCM